MSIVHSRTLTLDVEIGLTERGTELRVLYTDVKKGLRYEPRRIHVRAYVGGASVVLGSISATGPIIKADGSEGINSRQEMWFGLNQAPEYIQSVIRLHVPELTA